SDEKFLAVNRSSGPCRVWDLQSYEVVAREIFGFCIFSNKADNSHVLFITVMQGDIKAIMENSVLEYYLMDENWIKENNSLNISYLVLQDMTMWGNDRQMEFIR
ncbi:hypothetical protein ACJX0J_024346, partial [Zea mays]